MQRVSLPDLLQQLCMDSTFLLFTCMVLYTSHFSYWCQNFPFFFPSLFSLTIPFAFCLFFFTPLESMHFDECPLESCLSLLNHVYFEVPFLQLMLSFAWTLFSISRFRMHLVFVVAVPHQPQTPSLVSFFCLHCSCFGLPLSATECFNEGGVEKCERACTGIWQFFPLIFTYF